MVAANIRVNGVAGSDDDVPIGATVTLDNVNDGDESSWTWQILSQPSGTADALSATSGATVTFAPRREGSYRIKLVVDQGLVTRREHQVIVAVRHVKSFLRHPAIGEETQVQNTGFSAVPGWQKATEDTWKRIDDMIQSTCVLACLPTADVSAGSVVRILSRTTIKTGLPGEEYVLAVTPCNAISAYDHEWLGVVEGPVNTTLAAPWNAVPVYVRFLGYSDQEFATVGGSPHDFKVFLSNTGVVSRTPGAYRRRLGHSVAISGGTFRVFVDGSPCALPQLLPVGGKTEVTAGLGWVTIGVFPYGTEYSRKDLVLRSFGAVTLNGTTGVARVYNPLTGISAAANVFTSHTVLGEMQLSAFAVAPNSALHSVQVSLTGGGGSDFFNHWQSTIEVHQD